MADDMHMLDVFVHAVLRLTSLKITQEFQLLLGVTDNKTVFWGFTIRSSVWIMEIWIIKVLLCKKMAKHNCLNNGQVTL